MHTIQIYCDGATSNNGYENSVGGWAYLVVEDGIVIEEGGAGERNTTNQRMELKALIASFKKCEELGAFDSFPSSTFEILSDSAYCINCIQRHWWKKWSSNGWRTSKGQPVANRDLWEIIIPYLYNPVIKVIKVKGHTGSNDFNSIVDELAVSYKIAAM